MDVAAARVGPSVPRQERPARDGARVASIETGLAAAAAKLSHQVSGDRLSSRRHTCERRPTDEVCVLQEEQQKTKKKKKSTKKKPMVVEEPSQDSSSPEHNADSRDGSLTDHEFNTGAAKSPGGPRPMAPGVFLSQRRPSISSPNNSTNTTSTNNNNGGGAAKGERAASADAKGESAPRRQR